jgi:hypothetical protein
MTKSSGSVPHEVVSPVSTTKSTSNPAAIWRAKSNPRGDRWISPMCSTRISPSAPISLVWIEVYAPMAPSITRASCSW